jgi:hypothetical protein
MNVEASTVMQSFRLGEHSVHMVLRKWSLQSDFQRGFKDSAWMNKKTSLRTKAMQKENSMR